MVTAPRTTLRRPIPHPRRRTRHDDEPSVYEIVANRGRLTEQPGAPIPPPRGKERKGELHVLVEVEGSATDEAAERWRQRLAETFYRHPSGSLTSALSRAIQELNETIFAENQRTARSDRRYGTLACLVRRGSDAYFAVVGRAAAWIAGPEGFERLGADGPRGAERPLDPVGQGEDVEIQMFHRSLSEPWAVIFATPGILSHGQRTVAAAVEATPIEGLAALRRLARSSPGAAFRGLVVLSEAPEEELDEEEDEDVRPVLVNYRRPFRPEPLRGFEPEEGLDDEIEEEGEDEEAAAWLAVDLGGLVGVARQIVDGLGRARLPRAEADEAIEPPDVAEELLADDPWDPEEAVIEEAPRWPRPVAIPAIFPLAPTRLAVLTALAVSLFVAGYLLVVVPVRLIRDGASYAAAIDKQSQAEAREREAMSQNDPLVRRNLLGEASQLALQAQANNPGSSAAAATAARIRNEYETATGAVVMADPTRLIDLPTPGDEIVQNGVDLFVLDRANSRVYSYLLNADGTVANAAANPVLLQEGDRLGLVTVGQLTHLAWMPAGNRRDHGTLVVLDRSGFLLQYDPPRGLSVLALRDPDSWADVTAIAGADGNLYALRPAQGTLTWYPPGVGGYDGAAYDYFAPAATKPDLSDVTALAVGTDVDLIHSDGGIQRFADGKPAGNAPSGPTLLAGPPTGLAFAPNAIYVGDPRGARIVEFSRQGVYRRLLSGSSAQSTLDQLRDLAVSDDGRSLYVLADRAVYRFNLPPS